MSGPTPKKPPNVPVEGEVPSAREGDYSRVAIDDFISGKAIRYAVYIRLPDARFLKFAHTGDDLELDRIQQLKARGIHELWLEKKDFAAYQALTQKVARIAAHAPTFAPAARAGLVKHACEIASENLRASGINPQSLGAAASVLESSLDAIGTDPMAQAVLRSIEAAGPTPYAHAATCGMLGALLAKVMGWTSKKNTLTLTLASFMHDVGLLDLPEAAREIDPADARVPADTVRLHLTHPELGARRLRGIAGIPDEVADIVAQHHGAASGAAASAPMARIVALLDAFVDASFHAAPAQRAEGAKVLESVLARASGAFDPSAALALRLLLTERDLGVAQREYAREVQSVFMRGKVAG